MKREDVQRIFPEATDEQVTALLNIHGNDMGDKQSQLDNLSNQLDGLKAAEAQYKAQLEQQKKQSMSTEDQIKTMLKEAEEAKNDFMMRSNALEAQAIFMEAGLGKTDFEPLLSQVVSADLDKTKAQAQTIVNLVTAQRAAIEQATKDSLLSSNPRPQGAATDGGVTKEQFDAMSEADQIQLIESNPGILQGFTKPEYRF